MVFFSLQSFPVMNIQLQYQTPCGLFVWELPHKCIKHLALFAYVKEMQRHPVVFTYPELCTGLSFFLLL